MFKFLLNRPLWVNTIVAILLTVVLILVLFLSLGIITGHGEYEKVPNVEGKSLYEAKNILERMGYKVIVSDSVYDKTLPGLTVKKQNPESEAEVKHGRTIFLSVNRSVPPKIDMPSLIGLSYKYAGIYLQTLGLQMGDTTYRLDFAKNTVLDQLLNGESIKPGSKITLGSKIDFILGTGVVDSTMDMPDLIGKKVKEAKATLDSMNVIFGSIVVRQGPVTDTAEAFVVDQNPRIFTEPIPGQKIYQKIKPGSPVDVYISINKPVKDSTNSYPPEYKTSKKK